MTLKAFKKNLSTPAEYDAALKTLSILVDKGDQATQAELDYLDLLGTLVEEYERRNQPELETELQKIVTPVEAIRWAMDRHGLRQKDLVPFIGSEALVSSVLNGRRGLSKAMISRLHEGLGIPLENLFVPSRKFSLARSAAIF